MRIALPVCWVVGARARALPRAHENGHRPASTGHRESSCTQDLSKVSRVSTVSGLLENDGGVFPKLERERSSYSRLFQRTTLSVAHCIHSYVFVFNTGNFLVDSVAEHAPTSKDARETPAPKKRRRKES